MSIQPNRFIPSMVPARDYLIKLENMPTELKIQEIEKLEKGKNQLEKKVSEVDNKLRIVKHLPDVAAYIVCRDKISMSILNELSQREGISYEAFFTQSVADPHTSGIILNRLDYLAHAEFLETEGKGIAYFLYPESVIKLTDKGRSAKYIESDKTEEGDRKNAS